MVPTRALAEAAVGTSKLTKTVAAELAPRAITFIEWDADLPGFGLRVTPNGAKAWIIEYRAGGGGRRAPSRRMTLGPLATLTAEKARGAAKDLLAAARLGADPAKDRQSARAAPTVGELSKIFLKPETKVDRKASTLALYDLYFRVHILPALGSKRVQDVTDADVVKLHRDVGVEKPVTANRLIKVLSGFFSWAITDQKIRMDNPAKGIDLFREEGRERYLTSEELSRLGDALREAETTGLPHLVDDTKKSKHARKPENRFTKIDQFAAAAIRLLIFTGARLREILHLEWRNVDLERGLLFLDDSKTGRKPIILNAPALQILTDLPRIGKYVIAGQSAGAKDEQPRADLQRPWGALVKRAALGGLRIHDLRHTHASVGAGANLGLPIIGRLLGHRHPDTTAKYAHLDNDPLRRASERIAIEIAAAMGEPPRPAADVRSIGRRK
ncbi:tyrosine-type recombinase/integrase [Bradyrhizobium sp. 164]|nr:site-specific integrase [Bradyrhizobium sp. 164]MCK1595578.1 tyrosine-type recombinase/integrase [Bradyrhizobium sp. 164]